MLCPEEEAAAALAEQDLLDFLLQDELFLGKEPEQWGLPPPQARPGEEEDDELQELLRGLWSPFGEEWDGSAERSGPSSLAEDRSPAGSPPGSGSVQSDHSYSLHPSAPAPQREAALEMGEGDVAIDLDMWANVEAYEGLGLAVAVPAGEPLVGGGLQLGFPPLILTDEEKQLLEKEGVSIPSNLPLTKAEERVLKRVRRKIRNKQSAQDSRRRKKIYVDNLESRVLACTAQNSELQRKVQLLQKQNMSLLEQLRKLQALVQHSSTKTAAASTCIMVLFFSFCLVLLPSIYPLGGREQLPGHPGVLSRKLREYPNGAFQLSADAPQPAEATASLPPGSLGLPWLAKAVSREGFWSAGSLNGSLNGSLEGPQSPPAAQPPLASSSNASSGLPSPAFEGLPPPPQYQPPGKESAPAPASGDQQPGWVDSATSVILQSRRSDEM